MREEMVLSFLHYWYQFPFTPKTIAINLWFAQQKFTLS